MYLDNIIRRNNNYFEYYNFNCIFLFFTDTISNIVNFTILIFILKQNGITNDKFISKFYI